MPIPENGQHMNDKAAQALHSTADFRDPHKPKSDILGRALLVALFSGLIGLAISVLSDSAAAFVPSWAVFFLFGYGAFLGGDK